MRSIIQSVTFIIIFLLAFCGSTKLKAQNFKSAIEYNNYIIEEQNKIIGEGLEYMSYSIHSLNYDSIEKKRQELVNNIRISLRRIRRMPDFNGNSRLKRKTIEVFELYLRIYETDMVTMLGLKKKFNNDYEALEAYLKAEQEVDEELQNALEQLSKAQERFAKRNDIIFQPDQKNRIAYEVDQINLLSNYSRRVFLEYFYVSWKFQEMIGVLHERNGRLLDRKREDVIETGREAINNLNEIEKFRGEEEYIGQTIDIIEYFMALSKKEMARIAAIYRKDQITESDAEYINKVFNDYNANIQNLVYNWNLANQFLWKEYIKE